MSLVVSSASIVKIRNDSNLTFATNGSTEIAPSPDDPLVPKIAAGVVAVIAVLSAILNGLVIIMFIKNPTVRSRFNYYLLNLAVTDFVLTVLDMPIMVVQTFYRYNYWPFSPSFCTFFLYLDYTFASGTMYAVLLISLDRFYAVFFPMRYRDHRSPRATFCAIGSLWLFLHAVMLPYVLIDRQVIDADDEASCYVDQPLQYTYGFVVQFLMYWTPLALVSLVYIVICLKLVYNQVVRNRKLKPAVHSSATGTTGLQSEQTGTSGPQPDQNRPSTEATAAEIAQKKRQKRERRKYVALSCLTVCVVVGWAPANFYYTIGLYVPGYSSMILYTVANCLQFGTCVVNPLVYHHSIPEIKRAMNDLMGNIKRRACGCFTIYGR